jgi:hypothetical protein
LFIVHVCVSYVSVTGCVWMCESHYSLFYCVNALYHMLLCPNHYVAPIAIKYFIMLHV